MPAVRLLISGTVQGVGYRDWATRVAGELQLSGWVRNLTDDRVEIWAEGPSDKLDELCQLCHRGPRHADVQDVIARPVEVTGATSFARRGTGSLNSSE